VVPFSTTTSVPLITDRAVLPPSEYRRITATVTARPAGQMCSKYRTVGGAVAESNGHLVEAKGTHTQLLSHDTSFLRS